MFGLGLPLSVQQPASKFSRGGANVIFSDYQQYVESRGGTTEASGCCIAALFYLGVRNIYDFTITIINRWISDGATVDSQSCFNKAFFSINV